MRQLTFEKILAAYLLFAAILAMLLPAGFAVENHTAIDPTFVPFAKWLRHTPGAQPLLSTYFLTLTAALPIVVSLLARHPQGEAKFQYHVPTLSQCIGATLAALAMIGLLGVGMYGHIVIDGTEQSSGGVIAHAAATSRFGLALAGPLFMASAALVFYIAFVKLPRMWWGCKTGTFG